MSKQQQSMMLQNCWRTGRPIPEYLARMLQQQAEAAMKDDDW